MAKYKLPSTKELFDAGVHYGHQTRKWHPAMEKYIYSVKNNSHIIDLGLTEENLKKACEFLYETAAKGEQIIVIGTKKQCKEITATEAQRAGSLYVNERWLGGTISNLETIKKSIDKLVDLRRRREEKDLEMYTKKERLLIDREIERLEKSFGGLVGIRNAPGALFVIDAKREKTAIKEANRYGIPVVALIDTNTNPSNVQYVIPGNDDGIKSLATIMSAIADAIEAGYQEHARVLKEGKSPVVSEAKKPAKTEPVKVSRDESRISTKGAVEEDISEVLADEIAEIPEEDITTTVEVEVAKEVDEKPEIAGKKATKTSKAKKSTKSKK